jgi:hypothetical protein
MGISTGLILFKTTYQTSPIMLVGGVAQNMPGGALPILSLLQSQDFAFGLLGPSDIDIDDYFANFQPLPGSTLLSQRIGHYTFANQAVAANAVIVEPLNISLVMLVPASAAGGYLTKLATITALQNTLYQHNTTGGTYTIATPSFYYTSCLMTEMRDISPALSKQAQIAYQFSFEQPLLTLQQAQQVQNSLLSKMTAGVAVQGQDPSQYNAQTTVGNQISGATPAVVPSAASAPAAYPTSQNPG